jgi:hypothetical protein
MTFFFNIMTSSHMEMEPGPTPEILSVCNIFQVLEDVHHNFLYNEPVTVPCIQSHYTMLFTTVSDSDNF